ncbi:hypothetical protein N7486_007937 [Penicillium sp. IBT 16267x]|nr:hypothetical protein N7486_007937 [Penicillium sp. IBT 16267x]
MVNGEHFHSQKEGDDTFSPPLSPPAMETDSFDMCFNKDWESLPTILPGNIEYWSSMLQSTGSAEPLHPCVGSITDGDLFLDPSFEATGLDPNVGFSPGVYLDPSAITPPFQISTASGSCMDFPLGSDNTDHPVLDYSALSDYFSDHNHNHQHQALSFENSLHTPFLTSPPTTTSSPSCLTEYRTPCIITATQYLRTLHTRPKRCLSRSNQQSPTGQEIDELEPPRMSGSVLKCNKEAGMSVCRMLQCACALRPQNQLLLASICSRLVVWYRAMIRACFSHRPGSGSIGQTFTEEPARPEKVIHEAVTIGDHMVDNPALGWNIQTQVILGELGHLQRLVDTLSLRIRQTGMVTGDGPSLGLPEIAHDRLVTHLSKEVQAVKNDLIMALG